MNRLRRWYSQQRFAITIGLILAATTLFVHLYMARFEYGDGLAPGILLPFWLVVGSFLLGAISAFTPARYRVISSVLIAVGVYGWTLLISWSATVDSAQSQGAGLTPTLFDLIAPFWVLLLLIGLIVGGIEYGIRHLRNSQR
ncbi:hypothetical protein [Haloterrigena alkaliphila]|uniref:hypothetical protein n=1 Tax=Haloterrigena alkaliphila TaxID=2816475 RepID=UPI001CFF5BF3|nr:hypothetical protein [Haloterrigena alkaliphila]UHQ95030.1 hypothetical protein J0X25_18735 [Haloterrigena alkaliphila]